MKASRFFIGTLKEAPADAEIVSHKLMVRAGMIRRVAGGIYNYLPVGLRSIRKVEQIVREEMNRAGAIELLMPAVQPAELWQESGRWVKYGPELLRFKDRKQADFVMGPTHEEVVTDIARNQIKSYRQLPVNFYQVQTKFRDEIRPRFGVMRGREFIMKDAYSFDKDVDGLKESYRKMYDAYTRIFTRLGLEFRAVAADNGSIGGSGSHEFHVIADTGEDAIAYCPTSEFAANVEAADALPLVAERAAPAEPMQKVATPGAAKCEAVADMLGIPLERTIKSIVLATDNNADNEGAEPTIWLLLLRGDHDLNEIKVSKQPGLADARFATEAEIVEWFGTPPGYLGPIGTKKPVNVIADSTAANMSDFVVGANDAGYHITGVNWGRDLPEPVVADVRNVKKGDPSPDGKGVLDICRGIEVGHVFQLGTRYSDAMNATFLDETGKPQPMVMGCYGIGITRILGAAIEQNFDDKGIIWPEAIAPFEVVLCPMGYDRSELVREHADRLYGELVAAGIDVILDDRGERPGVMFADWELIGVPHRLVIGERGLKDGKIEYQGRRDAEATLLPAGDAAASVAQKVRAALAR
ncbi:proline--tRNA ligase [Paraburkholderia caballeronis]|uniref:proline--tRNA ligase n=1 Tax=Paraburkholderia caballeronis TaxID=416943 RepID=UPI0010662523|nr:proline--tRNA ligase [Paraburkholderia caballeronis]TDV09827.1 prolyl-tRNA synthetase [Paraburkholderia caballeronis]TDV14072.1 prolyl-tRNA synthetase [Paraburkholderia caballeronis]TDV23126.1 prolyl-tRNA synthetase [Paraburkholderia caballeronis]